MRLKRGGPTPPSAIDQLKAGWLAGFDRDVAAMGWILLKLFVVTDRDGFRRYLRALERARSIPPTMDAYREAAAVAVQLLAGLERRQRTVEELQAAHAATGLVW